MAKDETEKTDSRRLDAGGIKALADKPATPLQSDFVEYLKTEVGIDPSEAKTKGDAFAQGVILATKFRLVFQASDFNVQRTAERRGTRDAARSAVREQRAAARQERQKAKADQAAERAARKAAKATVPTAEESAPAATPAKPIKGKPTAATTAATTTKTAKATPKKAAKGKTPVSAF